MRLARKDFYSTGGIWVRFRRVERFWVEVPVNSLWLER